MCEWRLLVIFLIIYLMLHKAVSKSYLDLLDESYIRDFIFKQQGKLHLNPM